MAYQVNDPPLGSWLSEGIGWIEDTFGGSGGGGSVATYPPGWRYPMTLPGTWPPDATPSGQSFTTYDDLGTIQQWKDAVIAVGAYPTRIPQGMANAGELAARWTGPDTDVPNAPWPWTYIMADPPILAADHRLTNTAPQSRDAIVPAGPETPPAGTPGVHWWNLLDWKKYALWGAIGVGAVLVLPEVLPALIPHHRNPPRRRRRR